MNALAALGLDALVAARGSPCTGFRFFNASGRRLGAIDRSHDAARFGHTLTMLRRGDLHQILLAAAVREGVDVRYGHRLESLRTPGDGVEARFENGARIVGAVLFGCDGVRSRVRALALPEAPPPRATGLLDAGGFASIRAPLPLGSNEMVFGRRAFFGAYSPRESEVWWFHNGPELEDAHATSIDPEQLRARLLTLHRDDPPWIAEVIRATPHVLGPWRIHELDGMPAWSRGRVCLLGDAAHAMSPSAGQGAALALEDAVCVARCLQELETPAQAFARFEALRRPRARAIFAQARRNGSGKAVGGAFAERLRDLLLRIFLPLGARAQTRSYAHRENWNAPVR
ncbi:MAG: FAD-dependent oxidoreductase, partial [Myxococcales bacterium]